MLFTGHPWEVSHRVGQTGIDLVLAQGSIVCEVVSMTRMRFWSFLPGEEGACVLHLKRSGSLGSSVGKRRAEGEKLHGGRKDFVRVRPGLCRIETLERHDSAYSFSSEGEATLLESAGREGGNPTTELMSLEGEKGQESIGIVRGVTTNTYVRTLSRMKTLKSRAHARQSSRSGPVERAGCRSSEYRASTPRWTDRPLTFVPKKACLPKSDR